MFFKYKKDGNKLIINFVNTFKNSLKAQFLCAAVPNLGVVGYSYYLAYNNHQVYLSLPEDKQREIYDACPEQKPGLSGSSDYYSSLGMGLVNKNLPPAVPYKYKKL